MTNTEAIEMMHRCINEIRMLRQTIATLEPRAMAYDNISAILQLLPQRDQGYGEDLCWTLGKRIQELELVGSEPVQ